MTRGARPTADLDSAAQRRFEEAAHAIGRDPGNPWIGGYADYEWDHLRLAIEAYGIDVAGRDVLEFGCNVGGSSVVMAALGGRLTGVDIDPGVIPLAEANLARHGLTGTILHADGPLPFGDAAFDLVLANSVLEYVAPDRLDDTISELHRVLRPGGRLLICGTASRLALRERHSHRWLVNYLPRAFDRLTRQPLQRGLSPRHLARAVRGRFVEAGGDGWLATRSAIHGGLSLPMRAYGLAGHLLGRTPGWISPYIELLFVKR